ncbi:MAG: hypothetical protein ABFD24_02065 [Anaerolineaceae bacterium]
MNETTVVTESRKSLFKGRPLTLILASVLLLLLILVYAVLPLTGLERSLFRGGAGFNRGQFQGNFNPNNLPNGQNFTPGNLPQGQSQSFNGTRQFNPNSGLNQVVRILTNILHWTVIVLGILALVGLMLKKRWGIVLAVILAVVAFAFTLPSLFRPSFNAFSILINIAIVLFSVGVVVLSLLPQSRKATAAV